MTCEIAILNRNAVALAADSAVTIGNDKIFHTVDKLFTLGDQHLVGIMIFGTSEFMGIGWETLVSLFSQTLPKNPLPHLTDYGEKLAEFILDKKGPVNEESEEYYVMSTVELFLRGIRDHTIGKVRERISKMGSVTTTEITVFLEESIAREEEMRVNDPPFNKNSRKKSVKIAKRSRKIILDMSTNIFEKMQPTSDQLNRIIACFVRTMTDKRRFLALNSGVVIAGFGGKDIFPSLQHFSYEGRIEGILRNNLELSHKINAVTSQAALIPFAQADEARTFIEGISPSIKTQIVQSSESFVDDVLGAALPAAGTKREIESRTDLSNDLKKKVHDHVMKLIYTSGISPVMQTVKVLPREELARLARALVSLSSFKKHVTHDKETVGGPIDVALISRAEGFTWVRKKGMISRGPRGHEEEFY